MMVSKISILKEKKRKKISTKSSSTTTLRRVRLSQHIIIAVGVWDPAESQSSLVSDWRVVHAGSSARGKAAPKEGSEGS